LTATLAGKALGPHLKGRCSREYPRSNPPSLERHLIAPVAPMLAWPGSARKKQLRFRVIDPQPHINQIEEQPKSGVRESEKHWRLGPRCDVSITALMHPPTYNRNIQLGQRLVYQRV
jgi:hypothetical protein